MAVTDLGPGDGARGLKEMEQMVEKGISSFKLFMAYPNVLMIDDGLMYKVMHKAGQLNALCWCMRRMATSSIWWSSRMLAEGKTEPHCHAHSRSAKAEAEATHRAIHIADMAGASVYIVHLSNEDALRELKHGARPRSACVGGDLHSVPGALARRADAGQKLGRSQVRLHSPAAQEAQPGAAVEGNRRWNLIGRLHRPLPFPLCGSEIAGRHDFSKIPNGGPGIENRMQILWHFGVVAGKLTRRSLSSFAALRRRAFSA